MFRFFTVFGCGWTGVAGFRRVHMSAARNPCKDSTNYLTLLPEPFNYPLPYTIAGDMLLKVYNAIPTPAPPAKRVMKVPNPQNQLSLFAPRFQVSSAALVTAITS